MSNPSRIPDPSYVLGLGSNLGDRLALLEKACEQLAQLELAIVARSSIYLTEPLGPAQPDYFNCAVLIRSPLAPLVLLGQTMAIEERLGRVRPAPVRWGPRTIDIDLLWWSGGCLQLEALRLPHPGLRDRPFALIPLLDVQPDLRCPEHKDAYAELPAAKQTLRLASPWSTPDPSI